MPTRSVSSSHHQRGLAFTSSLPALVSSVKHACNGDSPDDPHLFLRPGETFFRKIGKHI